MGRDKRFVEICQYCEIKIALWGFKIWGDLLITHFVNVSNKAMSHQCSCIFTHTKKKRFIVSVESSLKVGDSLFWEIYGYCRIFTNIDLPFQRIKISPQTFNPHHYWWCFHRILSNFEGKLEIWCWSLQFTSSNFSMLFKISNIEIPNTVSQRFLF